MRFIMILGASLVFTSAAMAGSLSLPTSLTQQIPGMAAPQAQAPAA